MFETFGSGVGEFSIVLLGSDLETLSFRTKSRQATESDYKPHLKGLELRVEGRKPQAPKPLSQGFQALAAFGWLAHF